MTALVKPRFNPERKYSAFRPEQGQVDEKLVLEGGKVKFKTQGRQIDAEKQGGVIVDYLRFTVLKPALCNNRFNSPSTDDEVLAAYMAAKFAALLGYEPGCLRPGRDYYTHTWTIENAFGHEVGSVSAGGESQNETVCFTLKGEGCTFALPGWETRISEFFAPLFPKITRIDLARDCWNHTQVSVDAAVVAYQSDHAFSYQNRMPKYIQHGNWLPCDMHSRTFQVGKRESGKLCRIYEKGHQYGMMDDPWTRVEVELRSVNRVIPWEALLKTGDYFAGAYQFCNWLIHQLDKHPIKIKTQTKVAEISVAAAMRWVNRVVAPTLVQLVSAMPNVDWLYSIVLRNADRRIPRSLRGLNHDALKTGLDKYFESINPGFAPAEVSTVGA